MTISFSLAIQRVANNQNQCTCLLQSVLGFTLEPCPKVHCMICIGDTWTDIKVCLLLFYPVATVFHLYHGSDMIL